MNDARPFEGRVAAITGGGSGIGAAVGVALAGAGATLRLIGRRREVLERSAAALSNASAHPCDVRDPASVDALFSALGAVDILVNAAGVIHAAPVHELTPLQVDEIISTNLTGAFNTCRAVLPEMRARRLGDIVNVGSIAAQSEFSTMGAYAASKAGLEALSRAIRAESRDRGVRVVDVVAGATATAMWEGFWPDAPRERMIEPESVAACIVSALSLPRDATVERLVVRPLGGDL